MHTPSWASDRPTASRCSVVGFVTPPHRAAAGGRPEAKDGRGGPERALRGKVSAYTLIIVETNLLHNIVRGCAGRPVCCLHKKRLLRRAAPPGLCLTHVPQYVSHTAASATSRLVPLSTHTYRGRGAWERGRGWGRGRGRGRGRVRARSGRRARGGQQRVGVEDGEEGAAAAAAAAAARARRARRRGGAATARAVAAPSVTDARSAAAERARQGKGHAWRRGTRGGGGEQPSAP